MRKKFFGPLAILLLGLPPLPAQVSSSGTVLIQHAPRKVTGLHPDRVIGNVTISESSNWAGYAVTGSEFTLARGSWTVPAVDCTAIPGSSASFWVGIDGWENDTVEQTGTDSDCDNGTPTYYAWYEFVPAAGTTISSVPVAPGDQISADVSFSGSTFTVTMTNLTSGKTYSKNLPAGSAKRASAEWIAEANGYRLSDFGAVSFGQDYTSVPLTNYASDSRTFGRIGDFGMNVQESIIVAGEDLLVALPSPLSADGSSFTVVWKAE